MLGLGEVEVHADRHDQHDQHIPAEVAVIALREHVRQPALLAGGVDDADGVRAEGVLPLRHEEGRQLDGDVVHHQREERLVRVPAGLEEAGQEAPRRAGDKARDHHHKDEHHRRQRLEIDHAGRRGDAADEDLPLGADVPELHLERGGKADRDAEHRHRVARGDPCAGLVAEGGIDDGAVDLEGADMYDRHDQQRAGHKAQQKADQPDAPGLPAGERRAALGHAQQGLMCLFVFHYSAPSFLCWVMSRPTSSFVVVRASTMPET